MNFVMNLPQITWDEAKGVCSLPDFSYVNPYLAVDFDVILTKPIVDSIVAARGYYEADGILGTSVSSGYRSPDHQVQVIINYLKRKNLYTLYPEIDLGVKNGWAAGYKIPITLVVSGQKLSEVYWWQRAWSYELSDALKLIINPAYEAMCLFHSTRDNGSDRMGSILSQTNHASGKAYDIGGGVDHDPTNEYNIQMKAKADPACNIKDVVLEHNNDCVHTDVL